MDKTEIDFLVKCLIEQNESISSLRSKLFTSTIPLLLTQQEWLKLKNYLVDEDNVVRELQKELNYKKRSLFHPIFKK